MRGKDPSMQRPVAGPSLLFLWRLIWTSLGVAAALLAAGVRVEAAESGTRGPGALSVPWSFLSLQGERLGSRVAADARIEALRAAVEQARFLPIPRGEPVRLSGPEVLKLSLGIQIDIIGRQSIRLEDQVWFDPQTGLPLYLIRERFGFRDYHQQFRFAQEGVFRRQREPASAAEAEKPPELWSKVDEHFYAYPPNEAGGHPVSETLIYLVSAGAVPPKEGVGMLTVFHKRQLHRVNLRLIREEPVLFDFMEKSRGVGTRHSGTMPARMIRIESRPIGSYKGDVEEFDFVNDGMLVYLSLDGRMPLRIICEVPLIGRVDLSLKEIRFN
jgi:hypothetical protein